MMDDLISRQAAIDAISSMFAPTPTQKDMVEDCLEIIENLPSAQQWIPCSERLPEADGRYLVTCSKWGAWTVDWNIWHNEPKPSWLWEQGITAWMPLPEPYKGEQE